MTTKKTNAATGASKQIEDAVEVGRKSVEQVINVTKEQVEKASEAFFKSYDEMSAMNKEGVDAIVKAGEVLTKGTESLGKAYFDFVQVSAEASFETSKAMMAAKTVKDFVDIQSDFARTSFDNILSESTRFSEMSVKVAIEAVDPLKAQLNTGFEKAFKVPAL
tara:strand:+ start:3456 stop:3944 length:489 start_codon:yes stop_codon:yes gene_type:complete